MRIPDQYTAFPLASLSHPVVLALFQNDFEFEVSRNGLTLSGFYRERIVSLSRPYGDEERLEVYLHHGPNERIKTFEDLVRLNHKCWMRDREYAYDVIKGAHRLPEYQWLPHMEALGLDVRPIVSSVDEIQEVARNAKEAAYEEISQAICYCPDPDEGEDELPYARLCGKCMAFECLQEMNK